MSDQTKKKFSAGINTFMTTEHFTLQSARGIINYEIMARVNSYFTILSSIMIASAFLAQLSIDNQIFQVYYSIAIPISIVLGISTFSRLMELGAVDTAYIKAINRIRHFYTEAAPEMREYMVMPPFDDPISAGKYGGYQLSFKGAMLSAANSVGVVNSIVATVFLGIILGNFQLFNMTQGAFIGIGAFIVIYILQVRIALWIQRSDVPKEYLEVRFPPPEENGG